MWIPWYEKFDFLDDNGRKWAYFLGMNVSANRVQTMWFEWVSLILLNIYFTNFNSTMYEDDTIRISETENISELVNKIHNSMRTNKDLFAKVKGALDDSNDYKHVHDEDFNLKLVLEKVGVELPRNDLSSAEALKYMEI